ncbi:MAG: tetratricopeptide repeat protein [Proteobacteria bacterium]|nr:tetratricopeptide repeat protein [Pseudomonadota bacterium]
MAVLVALCAALACGQRGDAKASAKKAAPAADQKPSAATMGSPRYHLELAGVHERHGKNRAALVEFEAAIDRSVHLRGQGSRDVADAYRGVARMKESLGDTRGAIEAFERIMDHFERAGKERAAQLATTTAWSDTVRRLVALYGDAGRIQEAEALIRQAMEWSSGRPGLDDQLAADWVAAAGKANALQPWLAEKERVLDGIDDDRPLRFLAAVYRALGRAGNAQARPESLIRVHEKLHELHPQDGRIAHQLIAAYEKAGRVDDAVALMRAQAGPATAQPEVPPMPAQPDAVALCPAGLPAMVAQPAAVATAERIARTYQRANRQDDAIAETNRLLALAQQANQSNGLGIAPYVAAVTLYAEQGQDALARRALSAGDRAVRTLDDRRHMARVRLAWLERHNRDAALKRLLDTWKTSKDPCLRVEAYRRTQTPPP